MSVVVQEHESFLDLVLTSYLRGRRGHSMASTQKAVAREAGFQDGYTEGMAMALSHWATEERIKLVKSILSGRIANEVDHKGYINAVEVHHIRQWMVSIHERWHNGNWGGKSDTEFFTEAHDELFDQLIWPEAMRRMYLESRKRLVLSKEIPADESDADWLREEAEKAEALRQEMLSLLS